MARVPPSSLRYDLIGYDRSGRRTVLVEVKARRDTTDAWAQQIRRAVLEGESPPSELFVLVVPDRIYLWPAGSTLDARPTYSLEARSLLGPYFEKAGVAPETIRPEAFELLVSWWLGDLARDTALPPGSPTLAPTGLLEALLGGEVRQDAA